MTRVFAMPNLLAEAENWRDMGRDFRVDHPKLDPSLILASLIVLVAVVFFLFLLHRLMNRQEGRRLYNNPKQLFSSLCQAHELSGAERRLLTQIARAQNVPLPATLFLEPDRFNEAGRSPQFQAQKGLVELLQSKLFAAQPVEAAAK